MQRLYRALLALRRTEPALRCSRLGCSHASPFGENAIVVRRDADSGPSLLLIVQLRGPGPWT